MQKLIDITDLKARFPLTDGNIGNILGTTGGYSSGFTAGATDQIITLSGYNPGSTSDATIISNLIAT